MSAAASAAARDRRAALRSLRAFAGGCAALLAWPRLAAAQSLAGAVTRLKPSVVPVGIYGATDNPRFGFRGSGFAVGDGSFVATNFHVLPPPQDLLQERFLAVLATRSDGSGAPRRARLVASDRATDLALLKIEGAPLPPVTLADGAAVREGQPIGLMGFPIGGTLGYNPVTHRGIVASMTTIALPALTSGQLDPRAVMRLREGNFEVLQLDATAYPGNSGGPVFDADTAQVLAIVNLVFVKGSRESALTNPTGITYAIPVRHLAELLRSVR